MNTDVNSQDACSRTIKVLKNYLFHATYIIPGPPCLKPMAEHEYWVYMLTKSSRNVLYTGVTNNLGQRIIEHYLNRGTNKSFTGKYYCYWLVYYECHTYINDAIAREKDIKNSVRTEKNKLINNFNPSWMFLNKQVCGGWPPPAGAASRSSK